MVYQYLNYEKTELGKCGGIILAAQIKSYTNKTLDKEMPGTKARRSTTGRYKAAKPLYAVYL
jgi:hypothetical protein